MIITPPKVEETFGPYDNFVRKPLQTDLLKAYDEIHPETVALLKPLNGDTLNYRYADDKWSVIEVMQHLVDAERTLTLRAMRFSRGEKNAIPSPEPFGFVKSSNAANRSVDSILDEWDALRRATKILFSSFSEEMLERSGPMRDVEITVRALGYFVAGHEMHHVNVLKERYLGAAQL